MSSQPTTIKKSSLTEPQRLAQKLAKINEVIKTTTDDFATDFKLYLDQMTTLFPKNRVLQKMNAEIEDIDIDAVSAWYVDTLSAYGSHVLELADSTAAAAFFFREDVFLIPGFNTRAASKSSTPEKISKITQTAIESTQRYLPQLYWRSMMLYDINNCNNDIKKITESIRRFDNIQKSIGQKHEEKKDAVLSVSNIFENCRNIIMPDAETGDRVGPNFTLTMIKLILKQSGLGDTLLSVYRFNEMLAGITDEKIATTQETIRRFMATVGKPQTGEIAEAVIRMILDTIRELPETDDPINRIITTFKTVSTRIKTDPAYKDFSIKEQFLALIIYAKNEDKVKENEKVLGVLNKLESMIVRLGDMQDKSSDESKDEIKNEMEDIVRSALDATGQASDTNLGLAATIFSGIESARKGDLSQVRELANQVGMGSILENSEVQCLVASVSKTA
jgi:hypothetical protein